MTKAGTTAHRGVSAVRVRAGSGSYPVLVGEGLLVRLPELLREHAPAARYAIITDDRVGSLYGDAASDACRASGLDAQVFTFPEGEASKVRATWAGLTDRLLAAGIGRDGCVVALGGGVVGDLAGFVAATYLRGIPLVQLPTSLVAMIDASVGGKVGVDVLAGKNLVGAFHPPRVVAADLTTLSTLAESERARGLVEALKHGAILDAGYFETLVEHAARLLAGDLQEIRDAVLTSVELKADVVEDDEREAGRRQILNFGHTLGHAIEAASEYRLSHGAAVAAGMILEARLGELVGVTQEGTADTLAGALAALGFGLGDVRGVPLRDVRRYLSADKKARQGRPRYVLLRRIGEVASDEGWSREVSPDVVDPVLDVAWRP